MQIVIILQNTYHNDVSAWDSNYRCITLQSLLLCSCKLHSGSSVAFLQEKHNNVYSEDLYYTERAEKLPLKSIIIAHLFFLCDACTLKFKHIASYNGPGSLPSCQAATNHVKPIAVTVEWEAVCIQPCNHMHGCIRFTAVDISCLHHNIMCEIHKFILYHKLPKIKFDDY